MFTSKKQVINAESLTASINKAGEAFRQAIVQMTEVSDKANATIKQHEDEIAILQKENENLKQVSERAARINEKLSAIFE